jgi:hypothetical protein
MRGLTKRQLPPLLLKPVNLDQLLHVLELSLSGAVPELNTRPGDLT